LVPSIADDEPDGWTPETSIVYRGGFCSANG
jgi:hypothetical protein